MLKTRRQSLALSGNTLLHLISVRKFPRPDRVVLVDQIIFLQNNIFILNLLSACLHPHTPNTYRTLNLTITLTLTIDLTLTSTQTHTPQIQRYPPLYAILLLFSLYFCGIRQYFLLILIVSAFPQPRETKKGQGITF